MLRSRRLWLAAVVAASLPLGAAIPAVQHSLAEPATAQRGRPPKLGDAYQQPRHPTGPPAGLQPRTAGTDDGSGQSQGRGQATGRGQGNGQGHAPPASLTPAAATHATPVPYPKVSGAELIDVTTHAAAHAGARTPTPSPAH
jgi:hypothetical protein